MISMSRRAFTLIELLVSMALIAIISTVATTTFMQLLTMSRRLQALQTMDASAKTLYEKMNGEVTVIHPCAAMWLSSKSAPKNVEFVFMKGKFANWDYLDNKSEWAQAKNWDIGYSDLLWSRWNWSATSEILEVSQSRRCRYFRVSGSQTRNYWKIPGGSRMGDYLSLFVSVPQLQRDTGMGPLPHEAKDILNTNMWDTGEKNDYGDYDDLVRNASPLLFHCTDFSIELEDLAGVKTTADGSANFSWANSGSYVDGRFQADLAQRPSIARIRFTLTEPKVKHSATYSFSFTLPAITRY